MASMHRSALRMQMLLLVLAGLTVASQAERSSGSSCDDLRKVPRQDRCRVIREECPEDSIFPYAQWYYCSAVGRHVMLEVLFLLWLSCLLPCFFMFLGDTAEHYFSPIMSQISQVIPKMRPRFAGVTFVALGNGAPDLSSNIAAIRAGEVQLSAGALTGAALFVQCIVAAELVAIGRGVKCRGAMVRDVGVYCVSITSVLIAFMLGRVGHGFVAWCLVVYVLYLIWVFCGDEWHARGRPQPDLAYLQSLLDRSRGGTSRQQLEDTLMPWAALDEAAPPQAHRRRGVALQEHHTNRSQQKVVTELAARDGISPRGTGAAQSAAASADWDGSSRRLPQGGTGSDADVTQLAPAFGGFTPSQPSYPSTPTSTSSLARQQQDMEHQPLVPPIHTRAQNPAANHTGYTSGTPRGHLPSHRVPRGSHAIEHGMYQQLVWADLAEDSEEELRLEEEIAAAAEAEQQQELQRLNGDGYQPPTLADTEAGPEPSTEQQQQVRPGLWQLAQTGTWDWPQLWKQIQWELSLGNSEEWEDAGPLRKGFRQVTFNMLLHLYTLQRLTIPFAATSAGSSPQWLVSSLLCCPLAIILFMGWLSIAGVLAAMAAGIAAASLGVLLTWHDTPGCLPGDGWREAQQQQHGLGQAALSAAPGVLAVLGFLMGVIWINTVAGEVVAILSFLAALAGIPPGIMGLTLLAWGNSLGDFFGNRAMAKNGHTSIAITACFAGPLFNMLMALALGFSAHLAKLGASSAPVMLTPELALGCFFLVSYNVVLLAVGHLNEGRLPASFALFARGWYGLYFTLACLSGVLQQR